MTNQIRNVTNLSDPDKAHLEYLRDLTDSQRAAFLSEYDKVRRSPTVGTLLALFLGGIGAHRFYLGDNRGLWYLFLCWLLWPAIIGLFEAFVMADRVRAYNAEQAARIAARVRGLGSTLDVTRRPCPYCAEDILPAAILCKHCGKNVPAVPA